MKKNIFWILSIILVLVACSLENIPPSQEDISSEIVTITIVYTSDEHGWMAGEEDGAGAAELAGLWANKFTESDIVLPISGGDNWTGPAISTWFEGESMVEVMNTMGYAATAIGNHEFDFKTSVLAERTKQADFAYLGANIQYKANGKTPTDLGIQPYTIVEADGVQIGIIGLANQGTPAVTNPLYVADLTFTDYEDTLREYVPKMREAGADLILAPGHICQWELSQLVRDVEDLEISLFGGGHCHEQFANQEDGAVLLAGGSNLREYAFATFEIEISTGAIELYDYGIEQNSGGIPNPQIAEIISHWQELTDEELNVVIGYLENEIKQQSDEMAALITESWLWNYPADVAITNWGGMRDRIPAGEITYASIISVMPFENVLMDVALTGNEMEKVLKSSTIPAIGGLYSKSGQWMLEKNGEPLDSEATYHLLVNDFMYAGGDDYEIAKYDPDAYNTAINWRQPVIDWILTQNSSPENPLDEAIQELLDNSLSPSKQ